MRRRYRSRRRGSKVQTMRFQWYFDLNTKADEMQIISVSAGGKDVVRRLLPFFTAYKYYKLGKISLKLIPASTLPVDPTGLSYDLGEPTVDPRDQLTPGLVRITNGEDIIEDITGMSVTQQHAIFDSMMLGTRWYKWMLQRGVKRSAYPKYWQVGQLKQDHFPGTTINYPVRQFVEGTNELVSVPGDTFAVNSLVGQSFDNTGSQANVGYIYRNQANVSDPRGLFQTGMRGTLGWMPTDGVQPLVTEVGREWEETPLMAAVPEVDCFKIVLPPAYKTSYYYRAYVTETVYFREPVVNDFGSDDGLFYGELDRFIRPTAPELKLPGESSYLLDSDLQGVQNNGSD